MKKNMGTADRLVRFFLAIVLVALWYSGIISGILGTILLILAAVFVLTSLVSFCPLYLPFGLNTCPAEDKAG